MPFQKGNKLGRGKKGRSGRRSAYQEKADADFLWKVFTGKLNKEELTKLLQDRHSIKDAWIVKAFSGNEKFIMQIINKLFPDNYAIKQQETKKLIVLDGPRIRKDIAP